MNQKEGHKNFLLICVLLALFPFSEIYSQKDKHVKAIDIYSDTWVATDAIGRTMPMASST